MDTNNTAESGGVVATAIEGKVGIRNHELFPIWSSMKSRCNNPKHRKYHRYGGRGIKVCERWLDFQNFVIDMGPRPEGHTVERSRNDGDYEPGNCVWATYTEQNNNRSNVKKVQYKGSEVTVAELATMTGIARKVLAQRILRRGWDVDRAVTSDPAMHHNSSQSRELSK